MGVSRQVASGGGGGVGVRHAQGWQKIKGIHDGSLSVKDSLRGHIRNSPRIARYDSQNCLSLRGGGGHEGQLK